MRALFLEELSKRGIVSDACKVIGIARQTAYQWRDQDAEFAAAWADALDRAIDTAEAAAWQRAVDGIDKPLIGRIGKDQDGVIEVIKEYSDTLLTLILKANRPDKYREKSREEPLPPVDWDRVSEADQVAFVEGKISLADVIKRQQPRD